MSHSDSLRIAQLVSLWARVPPRDYGGIELISHYLVNALVERGHRVTLFASGDSETKAGLHAVCKENLLDMMARDEAYQYEYYANASFAEAVADGESFDIVHSHLGPTMIPFSMLSETPVLHTMRTELAVDDRWMLMRYPNAHVSAISHSQIKPIPEERRRPIHVVYNGCNFEAYDHSTEPDDYLAFLGRMGPHKNPLAAIRIAQQLGMRIVLAGKPQDATEQTYFTEVIKPLIDDKQVIYIGPVGHQAKVELLRGARALLFPIQWEEPFGNVMVEAMACGTPVVACNCGSVSEVIDVGKTGYHAKSVEELTHLVPRAIELDRIAIRDHAMRRFSHHKMAEDYLKTYQLLVAGN